MFKIPIKINENGFVLTFDNSGIQCFLVWKHLSQVTSDLWVLQSEVLR